MTFKGYGTTFLLLLILHNSLIIHSPQIEHTYFDCRNMEPTPVDSSVTPKVDDTSQASTNRTLLDWFQLTYMKSVDNVGSLFACSFVMHDVKCEIIC